MSATNKNSREVPNKSSPPVKGEYPEGGRGCLPERRFPEFRDAGTWEEKTLGNIGEFVGGGTPDTSVSEYWNGDIQWFTPTEIKQQNLSNSKRTITEKGLQNSSAKLLPKGALLLSTRATVGDVGIANNPCATNQGFQSLLVNNSEINRFWYYWIIQHKNDLIRRSSGSTFLEIGKTEIKKVAVLRPIKKEQQKIAACLTSIDDLITAEAQNLNALKTHKKGLMQQLFPCEGEVIPRLRFPEFKDAGDWDEIEIGDVGPASMCKRVMKNETAISGEIPFFKIGTFGKEPDAYISRELFEDYKERYSFPKVGDILISASGTIGRLVVFNGLPSYFQDSNIVWVDNDESLVRNSFLLRCYEKTTWTSEGNTIARLYNNNLMSMEITIPSMPEQQKIAACLTSIDNLITAQAQKLDALKTHKKGLMQQLFPTSDEVKV